MSTNSEHKKRQVGKDEDRSRPSSLAGAAVDELYPQIATLVGLELFVRDTEFADNLRGIQPNLNRNLSPLPSIVQHAADIHEKFLPIPEIPAVHGRKLARNY